MLLFGSLFAIFSPRISSQPFYRDFGFWHGLIFTSIFNVAVVYALVIFPDWMWMYYPEHIQNNFSELLYLFLFLYYLPYLLGFYLGQEFLKVSKIMWGIWLFILVLSEVWLIIHLFDRYSVTGTREQYLNGTAISLFSSDNPIGPVMNGSVALMVVYFILVCYLQRRKQKD